MKEKKKLFIFPTEDLNIKRCKSKNTIGIVSHFITNPLDIKVNYNDNYTHLMVNMTN